MEIGKELKMALLIAGFELEDHGSIIIYRNSHETITINSSQILHEDHATSSTLTRGRGKPSVAVCRLFPTYEDLLLFLEGNIL